MTRKLASVQSIESLEQIENSDNLLKAKVLGWISVVRKDDFKVGDKIVFVEIDSILPEKQEFEFLRKNKFRIKSCKLRGQISQGIVFPLSILPEGTYDVGLDVTELLGIKKWEMEVPTYISGEVKGKFPSFIPKTDEIRAQAITDIVSKYKGLKCYVSEKIDGCSISVFLNKCSYCDGVGRIIIEGKSNDCSECKGTGKYFGVCSRNLELKETSDNAFWMIVREQKIEEKLRALNKNICLQGELCGKGIQDNRLELLSRDVYFFNVFDIDDFKYLDFIDFIEVVDGLGLKTVPILNTNYSLSDNTDDLVKLSTNRSRLNINKWREGIVIRPLIEKVDFRMSCSSFVSGRLSFKCINPEYLLVHKL